MFLHEILRSPDVESEGTTGLNDDISLLTEEEEHVENKDNQGDEGDSRPSGDEIPEVEEETKEEETEKVETSPIYDRPTVAQIKEKFPEFFKAFPQMRDVYFREAEFTRIFPTVEDAREANENNEAFNTIKEGVFSGNSESFFNAIKETNEKSLGKIADNLISTLHKVSPDAAARAVHPTMENLVKAAFIEGKRTNNENLMHAAEHIANYLFNDHEIATSNKTFIQKSESNPEIDEFRKEKNEYEATRLTNFDGLVRSECANKLQEMIDGKDKDGKSYLDPDNVLSKFVRTSLLKEVIAQVNQQMLADSIFQKQVQTLWVNSKRSGYSDEYKTRLISAFLARAKGLVPSIRAKLVSEALGTTSKIHGKQGEILERSNSRKETGSSGRDVRQNGNKTYDPKQIDWSKTSDADLFDDNVTFKK